MKQGLPTRQATIASHTIERDFQATLRQLRSGLSTSSARATVYKHLFVAALRSELRLDKLSAMAAWAREHLELEPTTATLISDLISAELPDFPHKPILLSRTERETILAIAILVLNADEQKHILELTALRSVMLCLDITTANNSQMSALARQGPLKLIETLPVQALPTALLNILRIVIADHAVHERERNVVVAIKSRIEPRHIQTIRKMTTLETGIAFDL